MLNIKSSVTFCDILVRSLAIYGPVCCTMLYLSFLRHHKGDPIPVKLKYIILYNNNKNNRCNTITIDNF